MTESVSSPFWSPMPGPGLGRAPNIVRIGAGERRVYVALSHAIVGAVVHWDGRRTVACTEHLGKCPVDHTRTTKRWEGWLAVQAVNGNQLLWLSVTEGAAKDHPALTDPANDLRGRELVCSRSGRGPRGELSIILGIQLYETTRLIRTPNAEEFCRLLWGFPPCDRDFQNQPQTGERPVALNAEAGEQSAPGQWFQVSGRAGVKPCRSGATTGEVATDCAAHQTEERLSDVEGDTPQKTSKKTGKNKPRLGEECSHKRGGSKRGV